MIILHLELESLSMDMHFLALSIHFESTPSQKYVKTKLSVMLFTSIACITNIYIYGKVYEKRDLACIIKKYNKNALRLICYNFRTVNAINFLFSTLHTAPFLYGKIHFGVLHLLRVSIATFDTPLGSNPP